ncbi:unnamed protein product [Sphacelaria rigidula]
MDLARLYKERKITNSSDFEWLKQVYFVTTIPAVRHDHFTRVPT